MQSLCCGKNLEKSAYIRIQLYVLKIITLKTGHLRNYFHYANHASSEIISGTIKSKGLVEW
jgi:hypothetical protein